jgi:hypothetical protein
MHTEIVGTTNNKSNIKSDNITHISIIRIINYWDKRKSENEKERYDMEYSRRTLEVDNKFSSCK